MIGPLASPVSQESASPSQSPLVPGVDTPTEALYDRVKSERSAAISLLNDTNWPPDSKEAAQDLLQRINDLHDIPTDVTGTLFKVAAPEFIHVLEGVRATLKQVSEKYGRKERGFKDGIKYNLSSLHRGRCADTLRACQDDIEKASANLRNSLNDTSTSGPTEGTETLSEPDPRPTRPLIAIDNPTKPFESSPQPQTRPAEQTLALEHETSHPAPPQDASPDLAEGRESRSPIRGGALTVARKTFKTVEAVSGAIPGVGNFVGAAAKVGLAVVSMIETMDKNEDTSKQLASHTSKLSSYLEHFKRKSEVEEGNETATHIENLQKELERIQKKITAWNSSGRSKKAFLSSDHATELKVHQDSIQAALDEIQVLVSLKTADLITELQNTELRAERTRLLDRLGDGSYGAKGNAIEDVICFPGTRVEILDRINNWIKDTSPSADRVLWIRGMAGRGKSTIASTVAHNWASKGSCAIFHFRRGHNALDGQLVCSLARQLGKSLVSEVKNAILNCVRENEDIAKERLAEQFKTLFVGSLGELQHHAYPIVIIVDALDECKNESDAVRFVRLIDQNSSLLPVSVKFLLTCRPEAPLLVALEPRKWHAEDLDAIPHISEDINRFVRHACKQIRDEHNLPQIWPLPTDLEGIVQMSQGLFQWARTAIAYIGGGSPSHRLRELLQYSSKWGGLDDLYHQILSRAFKKVDKNPMRKQMLSWVLGTLVVAPDPVTLEAMALLHADHEIFAGQENIIQFLRIDILSDLNSLLHIPTTPSEPMRLMHTSIRDLLTARERCENQSYAIDPVLEHRRLADVCLQIMERDLKQNVCNIFVLPKSNIEIQDSIDSQVTTGLRYCCRSWCTHLTTGVKWSEATLDITNSILTRFNAVSNQKLLSWLEVMSLIGAMPKASTIAKQVHQWLLQWPRDLFDDSLNAVWYDTRQFIATYFETIKFNALDIYASALPQCPVETMLWSKYRDQATAWILVGKRERHWTVKTLWTASTDSYIIALAFSPNESLLASGSEDGTIQFWDAQTLAPLGDPINGHSGVITSVVFSPDGKVLVSGARDRTIRLWDTQTTTLLGSPLTGHILSVTSVAFSLDGKYLASGSHDETVRLWNAKTRAALSGPLIGHNDWVTSVVFSPDSKVVASGSDDMTIRLWDARTGARLGKPLTGHNSVITSVAFSPSGKVLASGSDDNTVRLWNMKTKTILGAPLSGHQNMITSVAFSPDSKFLASGSHDKTIRLWDVETGVPLGDPLTGHRNLVKSVTFSPDGEVLASGSKDRTVRLWDMQFIAEAREALGDPVTGHSDLINSIVFSPNGEVLASGSDDMTIRLWDAGTGAPTGGPLTGHSDLIKSIAFSPNGEVLASGSKDKTVRVWDARTRKLLGGILIGHGDLIMSIAFSPDGKVLASGSGDKTIRLWDVRTSAPLGNPLTGHGDWVVSVAFSPDGKVLASGSYDKTARFWDACTGEPRGSPLTGHRAMVNCVVFSPNCRILASGSDDKTVRFWNAKTGAPLGKPLTGHTSCITSVVFSPDGKLLASGSYDMTVRLWNAQSGAPLGGPLAGHRSLITSVVFLRDSSVLVSVCADGMVRFWDPLTHQMLLLDSKRPFHP